MIVNYWRWEHGKRVLRQAEVALEIEGFQGKVFLGKDENGFDIAISEKVVFSPKQLCLFAEDDAQDVSRRS